MMHTRTHSRSHSPVLIIASLILALAGQLLPPPGPVIPPTAGRGRAALAQLVQAESGRPDTRAQFPLPSLDQFIKQVANGKGDQVRGVYVPGRFALRVVQQPANNYTYVSRSSGEATQFAGAAFFNVTALLAHNDLSGALFDSLQPGQEAMIVMGDGALRAYRIALSRSFQRVNMFTRQETFIDLRSQKRYSTRQIFERFYQGKHHLTFQTCLEKGDDLDWGVLFVLAYPIN